MSILAGVSLLGAGCGDDETTAPEPDQFRIISVQPAQGNVLTARVTLLAGIDSGRIVYQSPTDGQRVTPTRKPQNDTLTVLVAGLRAGEEYHFRTEGWRRGVAVTGDTVSFTAGALPAALAGFQFTLTTGVPPGGYTLVPALLGTTPYLVMFDSAGAVRWYLDTSPWFPGAAPADLKQLSNGNIAAYLGSTRGFDPAFGQYYEFDLEGKLIRTYGAAPPLYTDNHDLIVEFQDSVPVSAVFFGYDIRVTDLTSVGGAPVVALAGHQLIKVRPGQGTEFFWNAWDHLALEDWVEEPQSLKQNPTADFDHPNSLDLDLDGNYVVSWRNLGQVTKIDARTGALIWRWGGRANQFTFVDDAFGFFAGQHSVHVLPNGNYLVYDNGLRHVPPETRMAEYRLDPVAHTATLVWEYRHTPPLYTPFLGWVSRLSNGNTFIGWGGVGIVQEVTPAKATVWEATLSNQGTPAIFYRAARVPDLYRYVVP